MDKLISKKFSEFQYKYIADPDYKKEYDNNLKALHRIRLSHTTLIETWQSLPILYVKQ